MSEKSIYNDLNNILINENEFDDVDVNMTDIQKANLKRSLKKKIKIGKSVKSKIIAASVASLMVLAGVGYANPALAAQIPILNSITLMLGQTGDYTSYTDIINKAITYDGKSFTINSILCYDNRILIGYTIESDKKINSTYALFFPTFKINGKWLNVGSTGGVKNLTDNKVVGTIELSTSNNTTLPDNFKFDISFDRLDGTAGNWNFKLNVAKTDLNKYAKVYEPNQPITFNGYNFTIAKVALTPLNTLISMHSNTEKQLPVSFFDYWIVLDDKGNELTQVGGTGNFSSDVTIPYSKIDENTKYLTIIPYRKYHGIELGIDIKPQVPMPFNTKLPIELSEGKNSKVTINNITFSNDKNNVVIHGIIYGKLPNYQAVYIEGDNLKADITLLNTTIKKIDTDKYEFTREYTGLKNDKNYKFIVPNIDFDSTVTVLLK